MLRSYLNHPKRRIAISLWQRCAPTRRGKQRAGTCHNADSPRTVAMTILPTQGLAAGSVPANTERQRKPRGVRLCGNERLWRSGASFLWGSGETGAKTRGANQIDCSQDVVGEYAQGGFGFDLIETSGEEAPACCHSFDSSKWVLGRASPPPHEARIGLNARIHAL